MEIINRAKLLIPEKDFEELERFLIDKALSFSLKEYKIIFKNEYYCIVQISIYANKSIKLEFSLFNKQNNYMGCKEFCVMEKADLYSIFKLTQASYRNFSYYICVDKDINVNTFNFNSHKFDMMHANLYKLDKLDKRTTNIYNFSSTSNYISEMAIYNDFSIDTELLQICYLCLWNVSLLRQDKILYNLIVNKLDYYGYYSSDAIDILIRAKHDGTSKGILNRIVYQLLHILKKINENLNSDLVDEDKYKEYININYYSYLNALIAEGNIN